MGECGARREASGHVGRHRRSVDHQREASTSTPISGICFRRWPPNAEYLIVGGWAVGYHAEPRFTKDLDVFIGPSNENLQAVADALARFGAPAAIIDSLRGLGPDEFLYLGAAPVRVDILRRIDGVAFADAYARRETVRWDGVPVSVIGFDDLVAAKKAAGRERDRHDLKLLEAVRRSRKG